MNEIDYYYGDLSWFLLSEKVVVLITYEILRYNFL